MMQEMPTMQQLENFMIYGRVKNFTLAAREANITQSAFSSQMKKLEEILGVQLIVRSNRGSHLTKAGERFLQEVQKWLENLHESIYALQNSVESAPVELNVGVLRTMGDVLMNEHVTYFQKNNDHIAINVYDMEEEEILMDLEEDRIDLASVYLLKEEVFQRYEKVHFRQDRMVYYAPLLRNLAPHVSREVMCAQPLVQYPPKYFMCAALRRYFSDEEKPPAIAARLSTPYAMIHFCNKNPVGALLPERLLKALGYEGGWHDIFPPLMVEACLVYKKENPKVKSLRVFMDYIQDLNKNK